MSIIDGFIDDDFNMIDTFVDMRDLLDTIEEYDKYRMMENDEYMG